MGQSARSAVLQVEIKIKPLDYGPYIDAGIVAKTYAKSRAATVAIEALSFKRPVSVGDIVCIYCDLYQVGTTSMKIHVEVWSRKPEVSQREKVTEGTFVFVAIDEEGRTKAIES